MKEEEEVKERSLSEMVYHTDARVTAMEQQLMGLGNALSRIEAHMMNKPPMPVAPWVAIGLTVLALAVGSLYGILEVVELSMVPVREEIRDNTSTIHHLTEFQTQTHFEVGKTEAREEAQQEELLNLRNHVHELIAAQKDADLEIVRNRQNLLAIGDFVERYVDPRTP